MTKRNFFGNIIHTPEDSADDFAAFMDERGGAYAARICEDPEFKWCASVDCNEGDEPVEVHEFASEEALRSWLIDAGVPEDEIEVEA